MAEKINGGYDLTKAGPKVVERFDEATARDDKDGDNICILHGLEKAMIGTTEVDGHVVAVYERNLCIKCIAEGYSDEDIAELYKDEYTEEQLKNPDLVRELKMRDAEEYFEYNTVRTIPYAREAAPVIIEGFYVDYDAWSRFNKDSL